MEVSLDKQGRILIPGLLRESAGLVKEIVFVGMMNRVEIWDKAVLLDEEEAEDRVVGGNGGYTCVKINVVAYCDD